MKRREDTDLLLAITAIGCLGLLIVVTLAGLVGLWQFEHVVTAP